MKKFKPLKNQSEPVYMAFPGSESIQLDLEKLFLLAVSKENLAIRGNIEKNLPFTISILVIVDLESGFGSFPAGSREDFSRRIRICGQKCSMLASRGLNIGQHYLIKTTFYSLY